MKIMLKMVFFTLLFVVCVFVASANVHTVELVYLPHLNVEGWPERGVVEMPMFVLVLGSLVIGLLLGATGAVFEQARLRIGLRRDRHEHERLEAELSQSREEMKQLAADLGIAHETKRKISNDLSRTNVDKEKLEEDLAYAESEAQRLLGELEQTNAALIAAEEELGQLRGRGGASALPASTAGEGPTEWVSGEEGTDDEGHGHT
jgi:putative membrane protein